MNSENQGVTDASIERDIQDKGANVAPRITPADLAANIASEFYFTATDGVLGASGMGTAPAGRAKSLDLLTFCVLVLQNGFIVTGESACASPENFNAEIGRKIARENAVAKVWPLMGYALKEQLFQYSLIKCEVGKVLGVQIIHGKKPAIPPHQQRVIDEKRDLDEKLGKLQAFIDSNPVFSGLPIEDQSHLKSQLSAMELYSSILADRIARFTGVA